MKQMTLRRWHGMCSYCGGDGTPAVELSGMATSDDLSLCKKCLEKARVIVDWFDDDEAERNRQTVENFKAHGLGAKS